MDPKNYEEVEQIRYCKKCGCELASTSKRKLCENCRRTRNANIRKWGGTAISFFVIGVFARDHLGQLNEKTSISDDPDEDDE